MARLVCLRRGIDVRPLQGSSTQAIQTLAGVAGEALVNLGRTLKILQEVQGRKMNAEVRAMIHSTPSFTFKVITRK
jgi:hypothetical protein